jgi:hypothetical protein
MDEIWGRYEPKTGPEWIMSLQGKPCKILNLTDDYFLIRIFDSGWGIQGGFILSCPANHVKVVGSLE